MVLVEVILFVAIALIFFYRWAVAQDKIFAERGVPFEKPVPLMGNFARSVLNVESFQKTFLDFYKRNKHHKIVGIFNFRRPMFMINDPELIKKIAVKDFEYFPNHYPFFFAEGDQIVEGMLGMMKDQRWKDMRNTLTPIFTASKMRAMFPLMNECFKECLQKIGEKSKSSNGCELEMKQWFTKLSNDLIASTAFGLKINSYVNAENEFYKIGQSITNFRGKQLLKFFLSSVSPRLMKLLGIKMFDADKTKYFVRLVIGAMKYREENKIVRPDMIQLLMETKKESGQKWSDEELVAQCFVFFFAAFENNANLICVLCHQLMECPDVQQRLYEEVVEAHEELKGEPLNYDVVGKMKYMDMVVSEAMRLWGLAPFTDRVCSKDYTLTDEDGKVVFEFKKDDQIWFPLIGLQKDEQYFKDPETFDPERFSEENKKYIQPFTYIPFGVGPRICIANRYALMQAKAMLYYLLLDYKLERSPKTAKSAMYDSRGFQICPPGGFWIRFVPRK